jgi:hypothetical protein
MNYDKIRKDLKLKGMIPDGYGRSVVGGKEIITAPSKMEHSEIGESSEPDNDSDDMKRQQLMDEASNEIDRETTGYVPDLSQSFEPDSRGYIGDYHKDDLQKQWEELSVNNTEDELDRMVRYLDALDRGEKSGRSERDDEATRYLGSAVKYGRRQ